ncbi:MAG TPA: hypothetical protein VFW31_14985 [Candidatus Angelobacter sp.]|nr:hypothetical protein [Candidatus Angelobacter sp.]
MNQRNVAPHGEVAEWLKLSRFGSVSEGKAERELPGEIPSVVCEGAQTHIGMIAFVLFQPYEYGEVAEWLKAAVC